MVTVSGGTVSGYYGITNKGAGTVIINGGTISGECYGIYNPIGILDFYEGVIKGSEAIYGRIVDVAKDSEGNFYEIVEEAEDGKEKLTLGKANIASITKGEETVEYANVIKLQEAINNAEGDTTITILRDIIIPEAIAPTEQETDIVIPEGKSIIFDLNGKTIKGSKTGIIGIENNATLEVVDNTGENTGTIRQTAKDESVGYKKAIINKGNLTLTFGKIQGQEGGILNEGILKIKGGEVNATGVYGIYNTSVGRVTVSGGEVSATGEGEYRYGIYSEGTVTVNGGIVSAEGYDYVYGIYNYEGGTVEVRGGTVSSLGMDGDVYGIYNEGTASVSGGEVSATMKYYDGGCGIYNKGELTVSGGTVSGGDNGIENEGAVTVSGGEVSGEWAGIRNEHRGIITLGLNDGSVTITSPKIVGEEHGIYNPRGTFNFYDGIVKGTASIEYINDVNKPIGYKIHTGTETDSETGVSLEYAILVKDSEETAVVALMGGIYYNTLKEAIEDIEDGTAATIELLSDLEIEEHIVVEGKIITIDLKGHKITNKDGITITNENKEEVFIGNITIIDSGGENN